MLLSLSLLLQQTSSQVNITFGGVTILVDTSPWRMTVVDAATDSVVLEESSESDQRLVQSSCMPVQNNPRSIREILRVPRSTASVVYVWCSLRLAPIIYTAIIYLHKNNRGKLTVRESSLSETVNNSGSPSPVIVIIHRCAFPPQGFGRWTGEYFNKIYEGYLFRVGLVVEWHHATVVKSWAYTTDSVSFLVATSDPGGRTLSLNLTAFQARQFSMHTTVQGQKAEER